LPFFKKFCAKSPKLLDYSVVDMALPPTISATIATIPVVLVTLPKLHPIPPVGFRIAT
jgi:hypothetical protein